MLICIYIYALYEYSINNLLLSIMTILMSVVRMVQDQASSQYGHVSLLSTLFNLILSERKTLTMNCIITSASVIVLYLMYLYTIRILIAKKNTRIMFATY